MSLLMWNPICDSLLYFLLEKRCPALAKQFKDLFFPQHIDVTNDDLTHLVDYFSKPSKKRGLSSKVDDPERKKVKLEKTTDKHEESETPNSVATLQERETGKIKVLESSSDSSSDDDDTPVIVTPVKKPAALVVQLSSGSSSSSSDSDTEEETSSQKSSSKSKKKSHKNDQLSLNSQTPTSTSANSATNRCDFSARHTCQASPIPSTSSHDQGNALKAPTDHNVRKNKNSHQDTKLNKSTDPTLSSKKSSENAEVRKSNSFFDRLMGASSFPQVQSTPKSVISPACSQSTPKSLISPACSQPTPKSLISPACSQSTPKSVISPVCSLPTPKSLISPACSQSTPRLCRYGMDCRRRLAGDCQFTHTAIRKQSEERMVGPGGRRICRYGGDCRRMLYCSYEHVL